VRAWTRKISGNLIVPMRLIDRGDTDFENAVGYYR
jgi:hypothetical protein